MPRTSRRLPGRAAAGEGEVVGRHRLRTAEAVEVVAEGCRRCRVPEEEAAEAEAARLRTVGGEGAVAEGRLMKAGVEEVVEQEVRRMRVEGEQGGQGERGARSKMARGVGAEVVSEPQPGFSLVMGEPGASSGAEGVVHSMPEPWEAAEGVRAQFACALAPSAGVEEGQGHG